MQYVTKVMGIYTLERENAIKLAREILESEGKTQIQIFGATPAQLEGDKGFNVEVSYYELTEEEEFAKKWEIEKEDILDDVELITSFFENEVDVIDFKEYINDRLDMILKILKYRLATPKTSIDRLNLLNSSILRVVKEIVYRINYGEKKISTKAFAAIKASAFPNQNYEEETYINLLEEIRTLYFSCPFYKDVESYFKYIQKVVYDAEISFNKGDISINLANEILSSSVNALKNIVEYVSSEDKDNLDISFIEKSIKELKKVQEKK